MLIYKWTLFHIFQMASVTSRGKALDDEQQRPPRVCWAFWSLNQINSPLDFDLRLFNMHSGEWAGDILQIFLYHFTVFHFKWEINLRKLCLTQTVDFEISSWLNKGDEQELFLTISLNQVSEFSLSLIKAGSTCPITVHIYIAILLFMQGKNC